jgi:hypothetical protein
VSGLERPENIMRNRSLSPIIFMREKTDLSLNRSLAELCDSYWEFKNSDEIKTEEEESEFGALEDCLEGMGFVSHLM